MPRFDKLYFIKPLINDLLVGYHLVQLKIERIKEISHFP